MKNLIVTITILLVAVLVLAGCDNVPTLLTNNTTNTYPYICPQGTPQSGTSETPNTEQCTKCGAGFRLSDSNTCELTQYVCTNGTARAGTPGGFHNSEYCVGCDTGYRLAGTICLPTKYTCSNGTPKSGMTDSNDDEEYCIECGMEYLLTANNDCSQCNTGYYKTAQNTCAPSGEYICPNGTKAIGYTADGDDAEHCTDCATGYTLSSINTCFVYGMQDASKEFNIPYSDSPTGIWSDGTTMWVVDGSDDKLYAYNLVTGDRVSGKDFNLASSNVSQSRNDNDNPADIWSDGTTMWVVDWMDDKLYAYTLATGTRDITKEFNLASDNGDPYGIWSDGTTMWVADYFDSKLYAYTLSNGARDTTKEFNLASDNGQPRGIWSDGTTMWVVDWMDDKLYAYTIAHCIDDDNSTECRDTSKEFNLTNLGSGNGHPQGIWSDGTTMWVVDWSDDKLYAYNLDITE